ncbi:MAG: DUF5710 domain-containing protein [Moraxella sp.]|nr:DUF5710 domain-containing protein [Moraxella sp.]
MMIGQELQIGHDPTHHVAYLQSWVKVFENDPKEIFRAVKDADKISGYLMDFVKEREVVSEKKSLGVAADSSQRKPKITAFEKAIDKVVDGYTPSYYVRIGKTPEVLQMLGLPKAKVSIKGATIEKVMGHYLGVEQGEHSNLHNITPDTLKKLPQQLNEPIAVFKPSENSTNPNSYVVLTELWEKDFKTKNDNPVIVAMRISANEQHIDVTSVYGKDSRKSLQNWLDNNLIYWDKEKGQRLINTIGLQSPKALHEISNSSPNVKTNEDLSQYLLQKNSEKTTNTTAAEHEQSINQDDLVQPIKNKEHTQPNSSIAQEKTYLYVPYEDKDTAAKLGAKWDKENMAWYAPAGSDLDKFKTWQNPPYVPSAEVFRNIHAHFRTCFPSRTS